MQIVDNRNELLNLFPKNLKIAELGIFKGEFSEIILNKLQPSKLFLVDTFPPKMCSGDKDVNNIIYVNLEEMYESIVQKFKHFNNVEIVKSTTVNFLNSLDDEYLDIIYIDADHSYYSVKEDLNLSLKKIKQGGIIMGHDYTNDMFPDVVKAVDEFCFENKLEISFLTKDGCPTYVIFKL